MKFHDGSKYDGYWSNDNMHGTGTYTFNSGRTKAGRWLDDTFQGGSSPLKEVKKVRDVKDVREVREVKEEAKEMSNFVSFGD